MLKKIPVAQLALGMHIHKFCRSWTNDPFWIGLVEVVLEDVDVLKRIQQSDTREVWIETSKYRAVTAPAALDLRRHRMTSLRQIWTRKSSAPGSFAAGPEKP